MNELKPCLIDRNKIPFKELWQEASCFADDIVCAVGTDFMLKIAEAERKFICDLLDSLQQMEVVDAVPVVRCKDCKYYEIHKPKVLENCERKGYIIPMKPDDFCSYGEAQKDDDVEDISELDDLFDDYDWCYECQGYGDDYYFDANGELVNACDDCPHNNAWRNDNV